MDIQITKIRLSAEESTQALPIVMSAIACTDPATESLETPSIPSSLHPLAFAPAPTEPAPIQEPIPNSSPEHSPTTCTNNAPIVRIKPPTGTPKTAKALVYSSKYGRYIRRSHWANVVQQLRRMNDWIASRKWVVMAVTIGVMAAGAVLLVRFSDIPTTLHRIVQRHLEEQKVVTPKPTKDATTTEENPADASDKAGQPKKLPMSQGAID